MGDHRDRILPWVGSTPQQLHALENNLEGGCQLDAEAGVDQEDTHDAGAKDSVLRVQRTSWFSEMARRALLSSDV